MGVVALQIFQYAIISDVWCSWHSLGTHAGRSCDLVRRWACRHARMSFLLMCTHALASCAVKPIFVCILVARSKTLCSVRYLVTASIYFLHCLGKLLAMPQRIGDIRWLGLPPRKALTSKSIKRLQWSGAIMKLYQVIPMCTMNSASSCCQFSKVEVP